MLGNVRFGSLADIVHVRVMSIIPLKADIRRRIEHVCFVPEADMRACLPRPHSLLKSLGQGVSKHGLEKNAAEWQMPLHQLSEEVRVSLKLKMVLSHETRKETSP